MGPNASDLRNLADGYFGLNQVFIINIVLNFASRLLGQVSTPQTVWFIIFGYAIVMMAAITALTLPHNKKIAAGMGWDPSKATLASVLMGLNSAFCCGIIGYIIMQSYAAKKFREAGAPRSFFGFKKAELYAFIDQLQYQQGQTNQTF
ncbi:MAG: hypothetical protein JST12_05550 [Armatimonadetes bacterium]|nr:hypothetical protein [Armatimonadota bacterium]MBS1701104.1 hypothetical protein [Armatimonadota bacterium]